MSYFVPPLSRESRRVKHDPGRSPDFRFFVIVDKSKLVLQKSAGPSHQPLTVVFFSGINRLQWRGRGGISPRFPILRGLSQLLRTGT